MNNLAYRTWGLRDRPALVLLHGFLGDSEDWLTLVPLLEQHLYLVAVDLPGHGNSQKIELEGDDGFAAFCMLLDHSLNQLDLKLFSLLGYSLGGRLATAYSISHSHRIQRLLLESCHPGLESEADRNQRRINDQAWAGRFLREPLLDVLQSWYHQPVFADLDCQQRQRLMEHRCCHNSDGRVLAHMLSRCGLAEQPNYWDALCHVRFPVDYLYGERDLKFTDIAQRLHRSGCLAGLHAVAAAGHNVHREQFEQMATIIRHLLTED